MRIYLMTVATLLFFACSALAGEVSGNGPNGGRMADAANMHVEFVSKGPDVFVYTYDHDNKPIAATGMTGKVTVQLKGKTQSTELAVQEANKLAGKLEAPLDTGARVIVSVTPKGGKPVQARYTAN